MYRNEHEEILQLEQFSFINKWKKESKLDIGI